MATHFDFREFPVDGLSYRLSIDHNVDYSVGEPALILTSVYTVTITSEQDGVEIEVADVAFTLALLVSIEVHDGDDDLTDEEVEAYAKTTGAFAQYPYAREYLQSITARMGLPALTLPVLRLPSDGPSQNDKSSESASSRAKPRTTTKGKAKQIEPK